MSEQRTRILLDNHNKIIRVKTEGGKFSLQSDKKVILGRKGKSGFTLIQPK